MSLMVGLAPISVCGQMSGPVRYDVLLNQISLSSQKDKHTSAFFCVPSSDLFLAAKGAARGGLMCGVSQSYFMQMSSSFNLLRYEHFAFFLKSLFSPVVKTTSERNQSVHTLVMT